MHQQLHPLHLITCYLLSVFLLFPLVFLIIIFNKLFKDFLQLNAKKNHLFDILLDQENKYGKAFKVILQKFIERQNNELSDLLEHKIFDGKKLISIAQIK